MRTGSRAAFAVLALAVVPALAALHSRSFFSPDETDYAEVVREMQATGDLVVPHLDGRPWLEKPPLTYWLLAGAFALAGWGLPAAVLLNSLLTGLTALALMAHVRRRAGPRAGLLAAAAYLTMALPQLAARTALTDPALVLCTTAAVACFLVPGWLAATAAGVFLGLGLLAKGPVAALVVIPAAAVAAVLGDRRSGGRRALAVVALGGAITAPWLAALAARGAWSAWTGEFLGRQVIERATATWRIRAPWWYYLPVTWAAMFPWGTHAAIVVGARLRTARRELRSMRADLPEIAAVLVPLLAFSIATNKLPHYVLPALPFVAGWLGRAADRLWEQERTPSPSWATALVALGTGGAVAVAALASTLPRAARVLPASVAPALAASALVLTALAVAEGMGRRRQAWIGMAVVALGLRLGLDAAVVPALDRQVLERPLAEAVKSALPPGGVPIAHRWWRTSLVTYGVRGWRTSNSEEELQAALDDAARRGSPALVVVRADSEGEARAAAWRAGAEAREVFRIRGLGEINGEIIEAVVFAVGGARSGERWFYDADRPLPGETGLAAVEHNRWVSSFRWTVARGAELPVAVAATGEVTLRLRAWGASADGAPQRLSLGLDGRTVAAFPLGRFPEVHAVAIAAWPRGATSLALAVDRLVDPRLSDPGSADVRTLGAAIDWVAVDPTSRSVDLVRR